MTSPAQSVAVPKFEITRMLVRRYPWLTFFSVLSGVLSGLAGIAVIDTVNTAMHETSPRLSLLSTFLFFCCVAIAFRVTAVTLPAYMTQKIIAAMRIALCRRVLATPLQRLESIGISHVHTLLTKDIPALAEALQLLPILLVAFTVLVFGLGYIGYLSPRALGVVFGSITMGLLCYFLLYRYGMRFFRKNRDEHATLNEHLHATLFGIKELKLNRSKRRWFQRAAVNVSVKRTGTFDLIGRLYFIAGENLGQFAYFAMIGTLSFGGVLFLGLDSVTLSACVFTVLYSIEPLFTLVSICPFIGEGVIALERLHAFGVPLESVPEEALSDKQTTLFHEKIELRQVAMHYAESGFTLGPVDLTLHLGELLFIVGGNGSGKSTLIKTLTGLYAPTHGNIWIDHTPLDAQSYEAYRNLFSVVFADFHIFKRIPGTQKPDTLEEAKNYLNTLRLADKVRIENNTLSTTAVSQGERKRLALLCAYLEDRPIIVLDEWAADQDPIFKDFFYRVLLPDLKRRGKCVVAITHDDQYFDLADRVVKLSDGQLVSNDTLLQRSPIKTQAVI